MVIVELTASYELGNYQLKHLIFPPEGKNGIFVRFRTMVCTLNKTSVCVLGA